MMIEAELIHSRGAEARDASSSPERLRGSLKLTGLRHEQGAGKSTMAGHSHQNDSELRLAPLS